MHKNFSRKVLACKQLAVGGQVGDHGPAILHQGNVALNVVQEVNTAAKVIDTNKIIVMELKVIVLDLTQLKTEKCVSCSLSFIFKKIFGVFDEVGNPKTFKIQKLSKPSKNSLVLPNHSVSTEDRY